MTFDEKVKFLRTLPQFKVIPLPQVRAIAFAVKEKKETSESEISFPAPSVALAKEGLISLTLSSDDIQKILREYPDLVNQLTK